MRIPIEICYGNGLGSEITETVFQILLQCKANIEPHVIEIKNAFQHAPVLLKGPFFDLDEDLQNQIDEKLRRQFGLFAEISPCISYHPFIPTHHPEMDVVVIREIEEDFYTTTEYRQTPDVISSHKIISKSGCERIIRYAFEYAKSCHRKKLTCLINDQVFKLSDGLFHQKFDEISQEYPEILSNTEQFNEALGLLSLSPEIYDVVVLPSLYGSLFAKVAGKISSIDPISPKIKVGDQVTLFEINKYSQKNALSSLLLAAIEMLIHIGDIQSAHRIHNAWSLCIEKKLEITPQNMVQFLDQKPTFLQTFDESRIQTGPIAKKTPAVQRQLVGIDAYIYHQGTISDFLAQISHINVGNLRLKKIKNKGVEVWPTQTNKTHLIEQWRCRFLSTDMRPCSQNDVIQILHAIDHSGIDVFKSEFLYLFNGEEGY